MSSSIATEAYRVSPLQARLWTLVHAEDAAFNTQAVIRLSAAADAEGLKRAADESVRVHEILRTTFAPSESGPPNQVIHPSLEPAWKSSDIANRNQSDQHKTLAAAVAQERSRQFDLSTGPLVSIQHLQFSASEHYVVLTASSMVSDAHGLAGVAAEICARASVSPTAGDDDAPDSPMQYADVAEWQYETLASEEAAPGLDYWRKIATASTHSPVLPFAAANKSGRKFRPESVPIPLSETVARSVAALANSQDIPSEDLLLAAFGIWLQTYARSSDLLIGVRTSGRGFEELQALPGLFAKFLPSVVTIETGKTFINLAKAVSTTRREAEEWQDFLEPESAWSTNGAAGADDLPCTFAFNACGANRLTSTGAVELHDSHELLDRFLVHLDISESSAGLRAYMYYDASSAKSGDVEAAAESLATLIESATKSPETVLDALDRLPDASRKQTVVRFNDTDAPFPDGTCIHNFIEAHARDEADSIAVEFERERLTYGELNRRANRVAHRLRKMGVGPDVLVGICIERSADMIVGMLGILKAGGAYVPLDPAYPEDRLQFMLEDTGANVIVTRASLATKLPDTGAELLLIDGDSDEIAAEPSTNPASGVSPHNLVYVIYTSGSTGRPKGVLITHRGLVISNTARVSWFKQPVEKFLLLSSLSFDSSVVGLIWTLCDGGTVVLVPEDLQKNLPDLTGVMAEKQVSHLLTLPSYYSLLLDYADSGQANALRTAIVAGEACPLSMVEKHKSTLPGTALFSEYGATETTVFSSVYDCLEQTLNTAPVGSPIDNAQMYVLNLRVQPLPAWAAGEVMFGGIALSPGYLERPALTAERFIPNPFSERPGERLYRSGDLARHLPNGDIEFLGRIDNQVKIRGFRIELEEIESVLALHPVAREVAVDAQDAGTGSKRLVAYLGVNGAQNVKVGDLRSWIAERLPEYMVPAHFVLLDRLPKNPNGKIDRHALPDPGEDRPDLESDFVEARSATEKKLTVIWQDVLRLEKVGIHDNFFELGGDSILSIQIISRANQAGIQLTPVHIFKHQTIAGLAQVAGTGAAVDAEQGLVSGELPLIPIQHWFFEKTLPNPNHWNVSLLLEVCRPVDAGHLEKAAIHLLSHHDALRIRYDANDSWRQTISNEVDAAPVEIVAVPGESPEELDGFVQGQIGRFQASLDLANGPLMRLVRFDFATGRPSQLLWVLHHLVCDVVSWRVLIEDLQTAVDQLEAGLSIELPEKTTSLKSWATRLEARAASSEVNAELAYWLATVPETAPPLPRDFENGIEANTEDSTRALKTHLNAEETTQLLQDVPKMFNTQINDALLCALAVACAEWTGESRTLVDLEGHGREAIFDDVDLSRTVAWFTVFYPAMLGLKGASVSDQLLHVKEQLRAIPSKGFNYSLLRYMSPDSDPLANRARAEINFNYLGQFDQVLQESSRFGLVQETNIQDRSPQGPRSHILEVVASVIDGRLQVEWSFSSAMHKLTTIERLAERYMTALRSILMPDDVNLSLGDFADFGWDSADFAEIEKAIHKNEQER